MTESISATIDSLLQRIDNVKVCQDHWKIVALSLTQLHQRLNRKSTVREDGHLQEDILQTLTNVSALITSCSENESTIEQITYRDLETLLRRLQLRLVQHEVDLIDDCAVKVQKLSELYQKQQLLIQKVFDETMKQKLEEIEKRTKANTEEQLRLLLQKYVNPIESYLRCCSKLHTKVPLNGVASDIAAKVAQSFYSISRSDQIQLERNWRVCEIPLTRSFVQFKSDKTTSFERNEERRLLIEPRATLLQGTHSKKEASKSMWQRLVSAPYMMSMVERDRFSQDDDVSEENIIRTKRWIVILGDPGSGKTSFVRWLVHHLTQTLLLNGQHATDYGPLRIPILIRVGEFTEMLNIQPSLTLFDYIGKHKWMGHSLLDDPSISTDDLSCALQDYIKHGQALIILDGLDEIPVSDQRSKIINIVENFVDTYVQTPKGISAFDSAQLSQLFDDPSRSGGNQLIVTSRIVGYHAAPLAGQFAHYTIRPMDMEHMKDFVDYWFFRVHQHILDALGLSLGNLGENHGEALKTELEKNENVGLLDVASNCCLMSFVCSVAFAQVEGSPLPVQRILLYEQIVNSMLNSWSSKGSTIHVPKLVRILSDIATYIHERSASGLIHEEKMKGICIRSIKTFLNKKIYTDEDIHAIEGQASEFVRIFREDVGILAARGESLYGFLHLTFQEYFNCLKLIDVHKLKQQDLVANKGSSENKVQLVAHSLRQHMNDPRFRVPIALALGKISSTWSQEHFDEFCYEFSQEQDRAPSLLPLGAYTLITCINDLVHYPSDHILFNALDHLIIAAGHHQWALVCPFLFHQITIALKKFRHEIVSLWINNLLSKSPSHAIQTISALCRLIEGKDHEFKNIKWLSQSSCSLLQSLLSLDNENNGYAIDRLLVKITHTNHRLLPVDPTTFKGFLITKEIQVNLISASLFPLIIALYGGLKRNGQTIIFDPYHIYRESTAITSILIHVLSENDRNTGENTVLLIKEECFKSLQTRLHSHDHSLETVDLCIATVCLSGIRCVRNNLLSIPNAILHACLSRLKYISMVLRQFYFANDGNDRSVENDMTKFLSKVINTFVFAESSAQLFLDLLNSSKSGIARLRSSTTSTLLKGYSKSDKRVTFNLPNSLRKEYAFLNQILSTDVQFDSHRRSCSLLHHFTKLFWILEHNDELCTQYRTVVARDTIPEYVLFHHDEDLLFSLTFVPTHLQNLYLRLLEQGLITINPKHFIVDSKLHLCIEHILTECLMSLSNTSCKRLSLTAALIALLPLFRIHHLESFGSSLLWLVSTDNSYYLTMFENLSQRAMNHETGAYVEKLETFPNVYYIADEKRRLLMTSCVEKEYQRLQDTLANNGDTDATKYSACVSLARVCQWTQQQNSLQLLNESIQGALSINNKLVRLDALCVIAFYSHSSYDQIQVNNHRTLQDEIDYQLNEIYADLPLLLHTTMFIRCLPLLHHQQTIDNCLQDLLNKFNSADLRDQQVVYEALSPYLPSFVSLLPNRRHTSNNNIHYQTSTKSKSLVLQENLNTIATEDLCISLSLSSMYLSELTSELYQHVAQDDLHLLLSHSNLLTSDRPMDDVLCHMISSMLTLEQTLIITTILSSSSSSKRSEQSKTILSRLSNTLHRYTVAEFKACRLLECWMKWKDSNELYLFAWHAALLLIGTEFWSVNAAIIFCDLLCSENDRFRQRAEILSRLVSKDNNIRTSSKLGIDILLTLIKKKAHYQHTSPSANLTLSRMLGNITIDMHTHLNILLWLERYRIHALINHNYHFKIPHSSPISHFAIYLSDDITKDVSFFDTIGRISSDLVQYMCDLITSNFSSFLEIDGDTTSCSVLKSHTEFVVSTLVLLIASVGCIKEIQPIQPILIDALISIIKTSRNDQIRHAAVYALGYICDGETYKILFNLLQDAANEEVNEMFNYSENVVVALISSYGYCVSISKISFDEDDMNLFRNLLLHKSENVVRAAYTGLGRVLNDSSLLSDMAGHDHVQCYHALIGSTAYLFMSKVVEGNMDATAQFIVEHPDLLPIFVVELYNSIRQFTDDVLHVKTVDYYLAYAYPWYVDVAALIAAQIPAAFCAFIKDWHEGENFKRTLFYTSKQHNYLRRAACLTILSLFGELTVELCTTIVEGLRADPHIQNTCYKCLTRINSIKDEEIVLNLLFSYLRSKSINVRYATVKILLHLSRSSLISFETVQTQLDEMMSDPDWNDDLWLIEEQDDAWAECVYYYAGPLKDVVYSSLVQHVTGEASKTIRRNELDDIDADFTKSEKAARVSACRYETRTEETFEEEKPTKSMCLIDSDEHTSSDHCFSNDHESDEEEEFHNDVLHSRDDHQMSSGDKNPLIVETNTASEDMTIINNNQEYTANNTVQPSGVMNVTNPRQSSSEGLISAPTKRSKMCVII